MDFHRAIRVRSTPFEVVYVPRVFVYQPKAVIFSLMVSKHLHKDMYLPKTRILVSFSRLLELNTMARTIRTKKRKRTDATTADSKKATKGIKGLPNDKKPYDSSEQAISTATMPIAPNKKRKQVQSARKLLTSAYKTSRSWAEISRRNRRARRVKEIAGEEDANHVPPDSEDHGPGDDYYGNNEDMARNVWIDKNTNGDSSNDNGAGASKSSRLNILNAHERRSSNACSSIATELRDPKLPDDNPSGNQVVSQEIDSGLDEIHVPGIAEEPRSEAASEDEDDTTSDAEVTSPELSESGDDDPEAFEAHPEHDQARNEKWKDWYEKHDWFRGQRNRANGNRKGEYRDRNRISKGSRGKDWYKILNVPTNASSREIRHAYRMKALELHPDKTHGDKEKEELMKDCVNAKEVLLSPTKRQFYDSL